MNSGDSDAAYPRERLNWWQRIGGGSLTIAILLHVVILLLGAFWVMQVIRQQPEKVVDFAPSGGGGGDPASRERSQQKQRTMMSQNLSRIAAKDVAGALTLPEPDLSSRMSSLGALSGGGMSGGMGGSGSGGGKGSGQGPGFGSGIGPGLGLGGSKGTLFGSSAGPGLAGTFYDLKQDAEGQPNDMTLQDFEIRGKLDFGAAVNVMYDKTLERAIRRNLESKTLENFFQAPNQLRLTQLYVPRIGAEEAPKAFEIEDKVQGRRWVIAYRGSVVPPETGRFRFVGFGDDVLVVLVNNRVVLDGSLQSPLPDASERKSIYQTHTVKSWRTFVGKWVAVTAGRPMNLKILIGERPGGHYSGYLLIEKAGLEYRTDADGSPILPLFKMAPSKMPKRGNTLPELAPDSSWSLWPGKE